MSTARRQFDVFVLRYVPSVLEERFVNVGVLLIESGSGGFTESRFLSDWQRVRFFDPDADIEMLIALTHEITNVWKRPSERDALVQEMLTYSGAIQLWLSETIVSDNPSADFERLVAFLI